MVRALKCREPSNESTCISKADGELAGGGTAGGPRLL